MQCGNNVFKIFTGNTKTMSLKALYASTLDPLDLTGCTEISVALPKADGSFTNLLLSTGTVAITAPAVLGKFTCLISSVVSALLNIGELQDFNVTFTIAGVTTTIRYAAALSVFQN